MKIVENNIPRRSRMDLWLPIEKRIQDLVDEIEKMPANTNLTEAVELLGHARDKVADFIESDAGDEWRMKNAKPV